MSDLNGYVLEMLLDLGPFEILVKPFNLGGCRVTKLWLSLWVGWSFQLVGCYAKKNVTRC